jgi:hypothetical protein
MAGLLSPFFTTRRHGTFAGIFGQIGQKQGFFKVLSVPESFRRTSEQIRQTSGKLWQLSERFRRVPERFGQVAEQFRQIFGNRRQLTAMLRRVPEEFGQTAEELGLVPE